jgi:hypothetical protein
MYIVTDEDTPDFRRYRLSKGDVTGDGRITVADIDALYNVVKGRTAPSSIYDLDSDSNYDQDDVAYFLHVLMGTWYGDANLNGSYDSSDLTIVFTAGEYEDSTANNSTWADGDWNGDLEFTSADLVTAFTDGGYELAE